MINNLIPSRKRSSFSVSQSDAAFNMMFAFALLLIVVMNPLTRQTITVEPIVQDLIKIEAFWTKIDPNSQKPIDTDVDLWARCGDDPPIGYSNKGAKRCNYLRDDLGTTYDQSDQINYELVVARGVIAGEYCVNVHAYSNRWKQWPVSVQVTVTIEKRATVDQSRGGKNEIRKILDKTVELKQVGQEINLFCFTIDEKGEYDEKKTYQSDSVCLRNRVENSTGRCAVASGTFTGP